ncbi:MAG TPA: hypothetical protein VE991_13380 [Acidimicrobiales bacterium]|nr:hypothetical protein [Acidimicrobiales bacterium]
MRRGHEAGGLERRRGRFLTWALGVSIVAAIVIVGGTTRVPVHGTDTSGTLAAPSTTAPAPSTTTTAPAPSTTTTVAVPSAPAPKPPSTTVPPKPAPVPTQAPASRRGILPPQEPANMAPSPNFLQSCSGTQYDDSSTCVGATLSAIDNARAQEGLPGMTLPSNWTSLTPAQQIFVITNLERTVRGLPALTAMATSLDQAAAAGAAQNTDPSPPSGFPYSQWGSNWAGAVGNPLEAMYYWMYDDGMGSSNIDCTPSDPSGCWGHRNNVLLNLPCSDCLMGTGFNPTAWNGDPSLAEILVETSGQPAVEFTWAQEQPYL